MWLKAAGGGSYGSRWCERSERPPVSICSSSFDPVRGRGDTETLRDPCRGRNSDITQIPGGRSLALAPPATVRVASGDFASSAPFTRSSASIRCAGAELQRAPTLVHVHHTLVHVHHTLVRLHHTPVRVHHTLVQLPHTHVTLHP